MINLIPIIKFKKLPDPLIFNRPGLDIVISISSIEGVGIRVSSASTLASWSSLHIASIDY